MGKTWNDGGYSADVRMRLECGGRVYEVSELGPETMMLRQDSEIPPNGVARLVVTIDGKSKARDVFITCFDPVLPEIEYA